MRAREECAAMEIRPNKSQRGRLAEAFRHTEHAYLRAAAEAAPSIDALLAAHPGFLPAHLLKVAQLVAAKDAAALPTLERALRAAVPLEQSSGPRERAHLAAARAWLARDPLRSAEIYTQLATDGYGDALAVRLAQSCWYFLGRRTQVRAVAEHALRTWPPERPGFDAVLAMAAFGAAETNDGARAEELATVSLDVERQSPFAIHALAHALAVQDRAADGARELRALAADWRVGGRMDGHIGWHLALFDLELGDAAAALAAFDREQLPSAAIDAGGCADATDLLWRLELAGVDAGARWQPLAAAWKRHLKPAFWSFLDLLAGLALQRAGRRDEACALAHELVLAPETDGVVSPVLATVPALAALDAFGRGVYADASRGLVKALPRLGGSLPQRELLALTHRVADERATERTAVPAAA
jgi:tetratricopeptide (TPR) repeat protein